MARIVSAEEVLTRRVKIISAEDILRGAQGRDGLNGRDGKDGRDGVNGRDGLNGKDGTGFSWRGEYNDRTQYYPNDVVNYLGSVYICIVDSLNVRPVGNKKNWNLMAAAGASGAPGPTNLFVGTEPPSDPVVGTVWIDTN